MNLPELKQRHNIVVARNAGAGHRYLFRAHFARIRSPEGRDITSLEYVHRWGFDALVSHGHAAEGNSEEAAVARLCEANDLPVDSGATGG